MKYPQLVSTRAVNAISDWLVARLEQLGVEAPLIYSRLLLSLLQSSVQINDPIEFSNLETFLANRKGFGKRYPSCDTNTLRKITAVQCLMDIVSSEQEITTIESLVDELCEKVNDIEKQSTNQDDYDNVQVASLSLSSTLETTSSPSSSNINNKSKSSHTTANEIGHDSTAPRHIKSKDQSASSSSSSSRNAKKRVVSDKEDPRNRYYRAFPALSKEMEDSVEMVRHHIKSLTWPADRKPNLSVNINPHSMNEVTIANTSTTFGANPSTLSSTSHKIDNKTVSCNTAGVKRKTKRRRNQAMSKGRTAAGNNIRNNSYCGGSSSPNWDTDFEGSWEMGRDLIKEFIIKQNNRNRSTSESAAYNMATESSGVDCGNDTVTENVSSNMYKNQIVDEIDIVEKSVHDADQKVNNVQINEELDEPIIQIICCEEFGETSKSDDTLESISEITDGSLSTARRLYERDTSNELTSTGHQKCSQSMNLEEQLDFAQFKAKFNSNVEALWNNSNLNNNSVISCANQSTISSGVYSDSTVFNGSRYKNEDIKNFWTNYYSHRYDIDKFNQMNSSESCDYSHQSSNDYFSMPAIGSRAGASDNFDKLVGAKRSGGKISPVGVFLQNTIWSDNPTVNYTDTDESFLIKALNSASSAPRAKDELKMDTTGNEKYCFSYQTSKWSEGINGVPSQGNNNGNQQQLYYQSQLQPLCITSSSSSSSISTMDQSTRSCPASEFIDSTSSSSSSYIASNPNWQMPCGNNLQADVKSWNSSNPTSLTELYATDSFPSAGKKNSYNFETRNPAPMSVASTTSNLSTITLANHSTTNSGFIAYSRIKSYVKLLDTKPNTKWQKPELTEAQRLALVTTTSEDENLLNSERTHFHPIKMTYADGHTFEISNELDVVDFERSESGYLYLESEKYLEYTRSDILSEDDSSIINHYPHGRYSSDTNERAPSINYVKNVQSDFVIRFRIKNIDKACQTEANFLHSSSLVYEVSEMLKSNIPPTDQVDGDEDNWMDIGYKNDSAKDNRVDDEFDSISQWSMVEIGRKCADNNNSSHTLWGMCPACNRNMKSIPANRMLKAELNIEGDEIMSDLRYMQELYIGGDWEDQNIAREEQDTDDDDDDTDLDTETIRDCEFYQTTFTPPLDYSDVEVDRQQKDILNNLNKLISDLLRPENAQNLANALGAVGVGCAADFGCLDTIRCAVGNKCKENIDIDTIEIHSNGIVKEEKFVGGLWTTEENIIWKREFNPLDIFSRLNKNAKDKSLEKLNWEYSNLAEIWGKASPVDQAGLSTVEESSAKIDRGDEVIRNDETNVDEVETEDEDDIKIACKNMKNLLKSNTMSTSDYNPANCEITERRSNECKRTQGYYSNSKFKMFNRFERKRRHSASQNVVCFNNNSIYNKNNNNVYHNNNFKASLCKSAPESPPVITLSNVTPTVFQSQITNKNRSLDLARNLETCNCTDEQQKHSENQQHSYDQDNNNPQETIITCKYWTTMQPVISNSIDHDDHNSHEIDSQAPAASFFVNKNSDLISGLPSISLNTSSILKHVTLVSRPLTR